MSFEIFMVPFRDGEPTSFDRSLIAEIFGPDAGVGDGEISEVTYPNGDHAEITGAEEETVESGLVFDRAGGELVFDAMWRLADRTQSLLFWPDVGPQCAVTSADTIAHVPPDMLESLGAPEIVRSGRELADYISRQH